jgi:hypothetical protein
MPRFTVEFYKPHVLNPGQVTFADALDQIIGLEAPRRIRRGDDPAAILSLGRDGNQFVGEAARIRMEDLPRIINTDTGNMHDLDMGDREGLGEGIHFLYDSDLDVIAIQHIGHFRAGALERLIADLTDTSLDFHVILTENAWERFQRMDFVTKINFKLARPHDLRGQPRPALNRVFQEIDEFNGVSARIEVTVGRVRRRGLNMGAVRRIVQAFRGQPDTFKSLSITGAIREAEEPDAATHPGVVDFIKERLLYSQEVERGGRGRRLDAEGCRVALRRAVREHREHLRRHQ